MFKIISPGAPDEKEIEIKPGKGSDLVVMPPKSAIPGGSSKLIRFVSMNIPETEQIYRVMFEGVPSPDDPALSNAGKRLRQMSV
ncbi:hypothetical protein O3W44_23525 [Pantoea sp. LMR881]|uniref:hypothetical protein n=1 Tax=Pantoea sp. LMR881 TaxID=3014336 RepID=UPI0022B02973|nr:hypothetical protein [Pantoea sp. LMR881]MCZ4061474.1 hypothetical protein [Pantoea sp. LMR881]